MVCLSKIHEVLPEGYGLVVAVGIGSIIVNFYHIHRVMKARKDFDVPYPTLYHATNKEFNCIQRAHQNYLENQPQFLFLLTVGGLQYPRCAAGLGLLYLIGRIVYAHGYYTGDPEKRSRGAFGYIGWFGLVGSAISFAYHLNKHHHIGIFRSIHQPAQRKKAAPFLMVASLGLLGCALGFAFRLSRHHHVGIFRYFRHDH